MKKKKNRKMEYVWAPWRMKYINEKPRPNGCFFCDALEDEDCSRNLVITRGKHSFVILNRYPYTSGHLMVVPFAHRANLHDYAPEVIAEIMELINQAIHVLTEEYGAQGFNVGVNLGSTAGAGVADHVHFHVVPRWGGDTNFMTSVGTARVIPEDLSETYRRVHDNWPNKLD